MKRALLTLLVLPALLTLSDRTIASTACGTTSARVQGPTTATGCASTEDGARAAALLNWEAAAGGALAGAGFLCAPCEIPGQCQGTMVYDTATLSYNCYSTSSGNHCCTISSPQTAVRMSCSTCD